MNVDDELPTIVYVDEDDDAREDFYIDATRSGLFKEVIILPPSAELDEMINELLGREFEALVSDFRLADAGPVNYDGSLLVERFLEVRSGFPCFIRTSYDDEAVATAADVNRVYSKESKGQGAPHRAFFERVGKQIARQRNQVAAWADELEALVANGVGGVSAATIDRVLELDSNLEGYLGGERTVAIAAKRTLFDENARAKQLELLRETENLVRDIREALNDR
jgi:hypothetical protein